MTIGEAETLIRGGWERLGERMVPDASLLRIRALIEDEFEKIASGSGGWETLYRNRLDGRLWERFYPFGEMQAGGPESLRCIDSISAEQKYGIKQEAPKE